MSQSEEKLVVKVDSTQAEQSLNALNSKMDALSTSVNKSSKTIENFSTKTRRQLNNIAETDVSTKIRAQITKLTSELSKIESYSTKAASGMAKLSATSINTSNLEAVSKKIVDIETNLKLSSNASKLLTTNMKNLMGTVSANKMNEELLRTKNSVDQLNSSTIKTNSSTNNLNSSMSRLSKTSSSFTNSIFKLATGTLSGISETATGVVGVISTSIVAAGAIATRALSNLLNTIQSFEKVESTLFAITGTLSSARSEMTYLYETADRVGVPIRDVEQSYSKLSAAALSAGFSMEETRKIFEATIVSAKALNLGGQEVHGMLYALQQMISKGTVSMEELRQQFGERLPGALNLAAASMNMDVGSFIDMVSNGELLAKDFITGFSDFLLNRFSPMLEIVDTRVSHWLILITNDFQKFLRDFTSGMDVEIITGLRMIEGGLEDLWATAKNGENAFRSILDFINQYVIAPLMDPRTFEALGSLANEAKNQFLGLLGTVMLSLGMAPIEINASFGEIVGSITSTISTALNSLQIFILTVSNMISEFMLMLPDFDSIGRDLKIVDELGVIGLATYKIQQKASGEADRLAAAEEARRQSTLENIEARKAEIARLESLDTTSFGQNFGGTVDSIIDTGLITALHSEIDALFAKVNAETLEFDTDVPLPGGSDNLTKSELKKINSARKSIEQEIQKLYEPTTSVAQEYANDYEKFRAKLVEVNMPLREQEALLNKLKQAQQDRYELDKTEKAIELQNELAQATGSVSDIAIAAKNQIDSEMDALIQKWPELSSIIEQIRSAKYLAASDNVFDGIQRGFDEWYNSAMDVSSNLEDATTNMFENMTDALTEFVLTGKMNFTDFANSVISDLARIAVQRSMAGIASDIFGLGEGSGLLGGIFGGLFGGATGGLTVTPLASAKGNAFSGGSISDYSNKIVSSPTLFNYGLHKFAKGAGLMGEAGAEAVMPLTRTADGNLGVRATGNSGQSNNIVINQTISFETPQSASTSQPSETDYVSVSKMIRNEVEIAVTQVLAKQSRSGGMLRGV